MLILQGQSGDEVFEAAAGGSDALDSESFKALLKDRKSGIRERGEEGREGRVE